MVPVSNKNNDGDGKSGGRLIGAPSVTCLMVTDNSWGLILNGAFKLYYAVLQNIKLLTDLPLEL